MTHHYRSKTKGGVPKRGNDRLGGGKREPFGPTEKGKKTINASPNPQGGGKPRALVWT